MNTPAPSVPIAGSTPSAARITEIDISRPARTLGLLRYTDYTLVVVCGFGAIGLLPDFFSAVGSGHWAEVFTFVALLAAFGFSAYTGVAARWRD